MSTDGLFAAVEEFPNDRAQERFDGLVGIDSIKCQVATEADALLDSGIVEAWSMRVHRAVIPAVRDVTGRTALIVLGGDVGTGKTELAETVGDRIARDLGKKVTLFPLSLSARGHGAVGEMTTLLTRAFDTVREHAAGGRPGGSAQAVATLSRSARPVLPAAAVSPAECHCQRPVLSEQVVLAAPETVGQRSFHRLAVRT